MGVLLALAGALGYGLSDFVGGLASRRTSAWPVALMAGVGALAGSIVTALVTSGHPTAGAVGWGLLGGVGSGLGSGFLYRGFAHGRMGVVAPVSGVGAAVVPLVVGLALGERPAALAWVGLVVALPGIWLVSREPGATTSAAGLVDGALAGAGFGLLFSASGQIPASAGYWPLVGTQVVSVLVLPIGATLLRADPWPRHTSELWGLVAGVLASLAVVAFLLARRLTLLSVASVVVSLYPAATIVLAALLGERVHRTQLLGLLMCGLTVACVAAS